MNDVALLSVVLLDAQLTIGFVVIRIRESVKEHVIIIRIKESYMKTGRFNKIFVPFSKMLYKQNFYVIIFNKKDLPRGFIKFCPCELKLRIDDLSIVDRPNQTQS